MTKIARPALDAPASEWLVYGDSLQQTGDVRGELVALSHAVEEGRTEAGIRDAYVKRYLPQLLGQAANHAQHYTLRWKYSELSAVEIRIGPDDDGAALVRGILEAPTSELLHDVTLTGVFEGSEQSVDLTEAMAALASAHRITALRLVDERARKSSMLVSRDFDPDQNRVTFGSLAPFWDRLQTLTFDVADSYAITDLETLDAPELREFALRSLRFSDWEDAQTMCGRLAKAKWPKLESFEVRLVETFAANVPNEIDPYIPIYSAEDYDGRDDTDDGDSEGINWQTELAPVFANLKACPLKRLALTSFESASQLLEAVIESGLLVAAIEELDLSDSSLRDEHFDALDRLEVLGGLKRLVLRNTAVTEAMLAKLREVVPEVVHSPGGGAKYRYVVGQE